MSTPTRTPTPTKRERAQAPRLLTIGNVCRRLKSEFPDISISKIRYLEDQGLLAPKRTQGGYRLFGEDDVERLRTILQLQRDEFLPLRVIRQELASPSAKERRRKRVGLDGAEDEVEEAQLCERAGIKAALAHELGDFGLLAARVEGGRRVYPESDVEVAQAAAQLARFGVAPRHLRAFRTAVDRQISLLEALVAPALRSRNPERRRAGVEDLQRLAELAEELSQLLFWRELRLQVTP